MLTYRNYRGFIVLEPVDVPQGGGIKVCVWQDGRWNYACLFPNLEEETLMGPNDQQSWPHATEYYGTVPEALIRDNRVYWNYLVNFDGVPQEKEQKLQVIRFAVGGRPLSIEELTVTINLNGTVVLNNWSQWKGAEFATYDKLPKNRLGDPAGVELGWTIATGQNTEMHLLTILGKKPVPPISTCPGIDGRFDVYICVKDDILECSFELPGQKILEHIHLNDQVFASKLLWKEVFIGQTTFSATDEIKIHQAVQTLNNPVRHFGDLFYIKLVPAEKKLHHSPCAEKMGEIAFYTEPYTLAYFHQLLNAQQADELFEQYATFGVEKIISQLGRIGSFVMYPSKVSKKAHGGDLVGDDFQSSTGPEIALRSIDVLKVCSEACHRHGMKFFANLAINHPFPNTPLETDFCANHPEYRRRNLLDFSIPEVIDFATEHFREMAQYDIDGLSIQHTRFPYFQTKETLLAFQRQMVEKIGWKRRKELEIEMSFVANDPDYYMAIEQMLQEDLIDILTVGNLTCCYPLVDVTPYVELAHRYGKKVFGLIDAWGPVPVSFRGTPLPRPAELERLSQNYLSKGADGLYFYQSEYILSNPFHKRFVRSLKKGSY